MPQYTFTYRTPDMAEIDPATVKLSEDGKQLSFTIDCSIEQAPTQVVFERDYSLAAAAVVGIGAGWPIVSNALAVHPADVGHMREETAKHGIDTEFTASGQPIFRDRSHRKKYMKAFGLVDFNAGYGDAS